MAIVLQHVGQQQRNDKTARNAFFIDVPRNEIVTAVRLRSLSRFLFFFPLFSPSYIRFYRTAVFRCGVRFFRVEIPREGAASRTKVS
jgi:hypothetical protein